MPRKTGPSWFIGHWYSGSCRKVCFLFEGHSYCKHFQGHEVVSVPVDSRTAGLIIGKGGANIKAIKQDLQTREETKCNPWIISGPKEDVREFLARLNARFGVCALGGLDTSICLPRLLFRLSKRDADVGSRAEWCLPSYKLHCPRLHCCLCR